MENKIQLTNDERAFFFHILANSGNGVVDLAGAEYLTCDNYSCFTARDLIDDVYSFARVGGFMSSLESKGIIVFDNDEHPLWWITNAGVYLAVEMFTEKSLSLAEAIAKVIELSKADIYYDPSFGDEGTIMALESFRNALCQLEEVAR